MRLLSLSFSIVALCLCLHGFVQEKPRDTAWVGDTAYIIILDTSYHFYVIDSGGAARDAYGNEIYKMMFGLMPPAKHLQYDTSVMVHRFTHTFIKNGKIVRYKFYLYKSGAWRRERYENGKWVNDEWLDLN